MQEHRVINKYRDICFSEGPAVQPAHLGFHSLSSVSAGGYFEFEKFRPIFSFKWVFMSSLKEDNLETVVFIINAI